ncbi:MAG: hypothetical protein WCA09_14875, partial [Burkholderiales bacterium]
LPPSGAPEREGEEQRRGRRGRRDRHRERRPEQAMVAEAAPQLVPMHELTAPTQAEPIAVVTAPSLPESPAMMRVEPAAPAHFEPQPAAVVVRETPKFEPEVEQPRREGPREQPPAAQVPAPSVDPQAMLGSSGLVMIETDRSKARSVAPAPEQPMPLGRPRRERPRPQPAEPLVQIETHNK